MKEAFFKYLGTGVDFAQLPHIHCIPLSHGMGTPQAYARTWQGHTASGQPVVLSVCMPQPVDDGALRMDADVSWQAISDWGVVAV